MNELRHDPLTDAWSLIAPGRAKRPRARHGGVPSSLPAYDPHCPFCPGNEAMLPKIMAETKAAEGAAWQTRLVPNRYPALLPGFEGEGRVRSPALPARGRHEVIVEHPRHDLDIPSMGAAAVLALLQVSRDRCRELLAEPTSQAVILFRNRGREAGASQPHPHSQIITLPIVPPRVAAREAILAEHYRRSGRCLLCETLESERKAATRLLAENRSFLALVPYAAGAPCEMLIIPKRHQACFDKAEASELADLADLLIRLIEALDQTLERPPYNLFYESASKAGAGDPGLHWALRVQTRLAPGAGFELGAGMAINSSSPEADATALRSAMPAETE